MNWSQGLETCIEKWKTILDGLQVSVASYVINLRWLLQTFLSVQVFVSPQSFFRVLCGFFGLKSFRYFLSLVLLINNSFRELSNHLTIIPISTSQIL